jgi:metabotropic X receptor
LLDQNDICIAIKERLTKDSGIAQESSYDNIVKKLVTKQSARGKSIHYSCLFINI